MRCQGSSSCRRADSYYSDTLSLLVELIDKYELPGDVGRETNMALPEPFWRLRVSPSSKPASPNPLRHIAHLTIKPATWAAAQQERADKLLGDLQTLNEGLFFVSGKLASPAGAGVLPARMLPHVWGEQNLQTFIEATTQYEPELARCAKFKRDVLAATKGTATSGGGGPGKRPGPGGGSPLRILPTRISKRRVTESSRLAAAELSDKATGQTEPVLLEDKSYAGGPQDYERFVETRVSELAMILAKTPKPTRMRVLDCAGYVPNRKDQSFSLVFRFPQDAAKDADPISLQRLLPRGPNGWSQRHQMHNKSSPSHIVKPSLLTRYCMAQSLCQSLALLQACGVLHKGIAPANILFFKNQVGANIDSIDRDLARPFIAGFTWARIHGSAYVSDKLPSKDFASTSGLLQAHPAYAFNADQRYLKVFDLYSLGLVLLQIGLWRSLEDIADDMFPSPKSIINTVGVKLDEAAETSTSDKWVAEYVAQWQDELMKRQRLVDQSDGIASQEKPRRAFQEALVKNVEKLLLATVGEIYTRVVKRCLTGDIKNDGVPQDIIEAKSDEGVPEYILQDAIVKNIVEELEKCNA